MLVATGQAIEREATVSPVELAQRACEAAFEGAPRLRELVDRISMVNILSGGGRSPAGLLARRLGLRVARTEVSTIGGNSPQWLVNRAAAAVANGDSRAVLVVGAEAQRSKRLRDRHAAEPGGADPGSTRSEPQDREPLTPDRVVGDDRPGVGPSELGAGLIAPVHIYAMFESVIAHRHGRGPEQQRAVLGELMAPFTEVAADHPYAWFAQAQSPSDISKIDSDNRLVAEPYPKKMCAFMQVDQAAAVVVTSLAAAREAGLDRQAVFCWSGADASDVWFPTSRPDPGSSPGIAAAVASAMEAAGAGPDELRSIDLYSCFPCVVEMAVDAMGLRADDPRGFTVTGGLPYFGGPGNDYTLHAIATMAGCLREQEGLGLVSGLGWYATKHSIGIYGAAPPPGGWRLADTAEAQRAIDATAVAVLEPSDLERRLAERESLSASVVASTVAYGHEGQVTSAPAIVRLEGQGNDSTAAAHAAVAAFEEDLRSLKGRSIVGEHVAITGSPPRYRVIG